MSKAIGAVPWRRCGGALAVLAAEHWVCASALARLLLLCGIPPRYARLGGGAIERLVCGGPITIGWSLPVLRARSTDFGKERTSSYIPQPTA
jgi:hypothetical protein